MKMKIIKKLGRNVFIGLSKKNNFNFRSILAMNDRSIILTIFHIFHLYHFKIKC